MSAGFGSAATLARLRAANQAAMPDTCAVLHTTPGPDNPDGSPGDGVVTQVAYACRVAPSGGSPQETLIASRLTDTTPFTIVLQWDAAVSEQDTIIWNGQTLQVIGVLSPRSYMTSVRVVCKRVS